MHSGWADPDPGWPTLPVAPAEVVVLVAVCVPVVAAAGAADPDATDGSGSS